MAKQVVDDGIEGAARPYVESEFDPGVLDSPLGADAGIPGGDDE